MFIGNAVQGVELHATVLVRNSNRNYSPIEIETSNKWLEKYLNTTDKVTKKQIRIYLKQVYDAEIEELGCIADHEGKPKRSNVRLAKWFARLKG